MAGPSNDSGGQASHSPSESIHTLIDEGNVFAPENNDFKNAMKLSWAERKNIDLQKKNEDLEKECRELEIQNTSLKSQIGKLNDNVASISIPNAECSELKKKHDALSEEVAQMELQLAMGRWSLKSETDFQGEQDAEEEKLQLVRIGKDGIEQQVQSLNTELEVMRLEYEASHVQITKQREQIGELVSEVEYLRTQDRRFEHPTTYHDDLGTQIGGVMARLDELVKDQSRDKEEIIRLSLENKEQAEKIERLEAESRERLNENQCLTNEARFYKAESAGLRGVGEAHRKEKVALEAKFNAAKAVETTLRSQNKKMKTENTTLRATNSNQSNQINSLKAESKKFHKTTNDVDRLKSDIAYYITELDLADEELRVFTCEHKSLKDIPDGKHSTMEKDSFEIADEMFDDWRKDSAFMKKYKSVRGRILDHHNAHERVNQGRGALPGRIKAEYKATDARRGVNINYQF